VHPAIANLPQVIPGGKVDPNYYSPVPKDLESRIKRNDEDLERMYADLHAKEEKLRKGLAQWDKLARESTSMGLKAELSERHVRMLAGEGVGGAAF
jgi:Skp family chaperone for outer membrane proteins